MTKTSDVRRLCGRISKRKQSPYVAASREIRLATSIGAVLANDCLTDASDYVRAADLALYAAKTSGRNCYRFFTDKLDVELGRRDKLETALRQTLRSGEGLAVKFQPQLDSNGQVVGAEALFRWRHPELGDIPAAEAVAIAEEARLIQELGACHPAGSAFRARVAVALRRSEHFARTVRRDGQVT